MSGSRTWRKRLLPSPSLSVTVFGFWLLMNDSVDAGSLVMALLLALAVPPFAARLDREFASFGRLRGIPRLAAVLFWDMLVANFTVARQVLGPEAKLRPGFVWVPLEIENIHGIAALTSFITLTPGTVSSLLSDDRRFLLVHVLDMDNAENVVRDIKQRYERPLMEIFP